MYRNGILIFMLAVVSVFTHARSEINGPIKETNMEVKNQVPPRYRISVCDWMILKRQKLGALSLARTIGCDGLELDMGPLGKRPTFQNALVDSVAIQKFKHLADSVGIQFSSIAMSGFYAQSLVNREDFVTPIKDCITLMGKMNVKTAFLPLGPDGDLYQFPEKRPELVYRLKKIGAMAEKAGVVIGIETLLNAKDEKKLLREIDSKGIKSYFNFQNALANGRNLIKELKTLGAENICQIHCTNTDKYWLQNDPQIDMPAVKKALDKMGYAGWLVIERSRDINDVHNVKKNYSANAHYLKSIFQPE